MSSVRRCLHRRRGRGRSRASAIARGHAMRRRKRRPPLPNLVLVPVGSAYRPALAISQRPELAAAFAQGVAARASRSNVDETRMQWLMDASADEHAAYRFGQYEAQEFRAPTPIAVVAPLLVAQSLVETHIRGLRHRREKVVFGGAFFAAFFCAQRVGDRARLRRGRVLALTAETAPLPVSSSLMLGQLLLVSIQSLWVRRRSGRWRQVSATSTIAGAAIRELRERRDWNAAYRRRL